MSGAASILSSIPWFGWIAIVAIISTSITQALRWSYQHSERMEWIRQGINPDSKSGGERPYGE